MRLKPHTYRRLAWVACWIVPVKIHGILEDFETYRPEEHELQCLKELLTLYKTVLERCPNVDFTAKTTEGLKCWKNLCKDEDESIQTLTILFPSQRLDFRYPKNLIDYYEDNTCFSCFLDMYVRKQKNVLLEYVWVREQAESEHCHWHAVFFFNQNRMRYFAFPKDENRLWKINIARIYPIDRKILPRWGLVESAPKIKNGFLVKRHDPELIDEALRIISYLAKKLTKENTPAHVRKWGASYEK